MRALRVEYAAGGVLSEDAETRCLGAEELS
jgi:hypothetical protein